VHQFDLNGTAHFCILIDYRGCHRKGVAIYNANKVNLQQKTFISLNKNCIFDRYREVQVRKSLLINIIFAVIIFSDDISGLPSICLC
jgi:hypothetical protein